MPEEVQVDNPPVFPTSLIATFPILGRILFSNGDADLKEPLEYWLTLVPEISWKVDKGFLIASRVGRKMTPKQLEETLNKNQKYPPHKLKEVLNALISNTVKPLDIKTNMNKTEPIPSEIVEAIKPFLRWAVFGKGRMHLARTHTAYQTWEFCIDPWAILADKKHSNGMTYLELLSIKIEKMQTSRKTHWGCEEVVEDNGDITITYSSFMATAEKLGLLPSVLTDERFQIPPPIAFTNDPKKAAYTCIPLNDLEKLKINSVEAWTDFESSMPSWGVPVFRATFYATFVETNRSRQMLTLTDTGGTGKSSVFRAVANMTGGNFYCAVSKDSFGNQFWGAKVFNKRLIQYSDSGNMLISRLDKIKQLTGSDPIDVEFKNKNSSSWISNARVWISTNTMPDISSLQRHQLTRNLVIPLTFPTDERILKKFCQTDEKGDLVRNEDDTPNIVGAPYDDALTKEFWDYLDLCKPFYEELCPTGMDCLVPPEMYRYIRSNCMSQETEDLAFYLSEFLEFNPSGFLKNSVRDALLEYLQTSNKNFEITKKEIRAYLLANGCHSDKEKHVRGVRGVQLRSHIIEDARGKITFKKVDSTDLELDTVKSAEETLE